MKKTILFIVCFTFLLISCSNESYNMDKKKSQINLWCYKNADIGIYDMTTEFLIEEMKNYAIANAIDLNITTYSSEELSYEDYAFKQNAAIATGEADIIIDHVWNLYSIKQYGGDYSKLDTYENIFEGFRDGYCIPVGIDMRAEAINNDVLKHFGVEADSVITFEEYYELKEKLKQAGAEFAATLEEKYELCDYYINKNQLKIISDNNKYIVDKKLLKTTIDELYDEYIKSKDEIVNIEEDIIFEKNTGYIFKNSVPHSPRFSLLTGIERCYELNFGGINHNIGDKEDSYDCTMVIQKNYVYQYSAPCIMINKNTKNEEVYEVANILFSSDVQKKLYDRNYGVVTDTEKTRQVVGVDKNWKCIRENVNFNQLYDMKEKGYSILKNSVQSKFFEPIDFEIMLKNFILDEINKKIEEPNTYDDSMFEKNAEDFLINLNIKYN